MVSEEVRVFITKQAAAQRQLDAAIRMTLAGEDELAIHTVAAAAYGIVRALKEAKRERSEFRDQLGLGIFLFANDLTSGKLDKVPADFTDTLAGIITDVSAAIKRGEITNEEEVIRKLSIRDENMTYDPEADAIFIYVGTSRKIDHAEEAGPFIYDVDSEGRIVGIEILSASKVLAPGECRHARLPGAYSVDAAV